MSLRLHLNKGTIRQDIAQLPEKMLDHAFEVSTSSCLIVVCTVRMQTRGAYSRVCLCLRIFCQILDVT